LVQNVKSKPKAFWQYANSKVKICPCITELLHSDGTVTSFDSEMATLFNNYFFYFTNEDTTSIPATDPTGSTSIPESIDFTPDIVFDKL